MHEKGLTASIHAKHLFLVAKHIGREISHKLDPKKVYTNGKSWVAI
jgi:hypothetical protein